MNSSRSIWLLGGILFLTSCGPNLLLSDLPTIFITDGTWKGSEIGGLTGADSKCQSEADTQGLTGTWKAVLSTSTVNAIDRFPGLSGRLQNVVGNEVVAEITTDFWSGSRGSIPILKPDGSEPSGQTIFTGTLNGGSKATNHCSDWTSDASNGRAAIHTMNQAFFDNSHSSNCNVARRLYCLRE